MFYSIQTLERKAIAQLLMLTPSKKMVKRPTNTDGEILKHQLVARAMVICIYANNGVGS